jgi:hypothetical protein
MPTSRRKPTKAAAAKAGTAMAGAPPASASLVVTGPPGQLRTTVTVENTADRQVAVRGAVLHGVGEAPAPGGVAALIPAGSTATVPVSFSVDAATPPGEYAAELEVGGARRTAVVRVEPHFSMRVSPRRVLAAPGRQDVELVVTNEGNLEVTVAALSRARTDDGGPDPGPDVSLVLDAAVIVTAASSVSTTAHLEVPEGLDPTRRHTASIPVGLADLDVIILPRSASESPS